MSVNVTANGSGGVSVSANGSVISATVTGGIGPAGPSGEGGGGGSPAWNDITGKPSTFTPAAHEHGNITNDGLIGANTASGRFVVTDDGGALTTASASTGRTLLQLGGAATLNVGTSDGTVCAGNDARLSDSRTPTAHAHAISDVTGLQTALDGKQASGSYAASSHSHAISDVTGLQTALDGKQASGSYAASSHTHGNVTNDGKIGTTADRLVVTGTGGALTTAAIGTGLTYSGGTLSASGGGSPAWNDITGKPSTFTPSTHTHSISDVTSLQTTLDGKASTSHSHAISDVTGLQTALDGKQASGSYAAATHSHAISDVTGLQTALDGKAASTHASTHGVGGADPVAISSTQVQAGADTAYFNGDENVQEALTALSTAVGGKAAASHSHAASDITSGTISTARLGSGTANSSTFLRGDNTWATPSGGGSSTSAYASSLMFG